MSEHTPGPWSYIYLGARQYTVDAPGQPIGQCDVAFVKSEANARLIAAAPELLERLEFIDRQASEIALRMRDKAEKHLSWDGVACILEHIAANARNAIAKAETRS